MVGNRRRRDLLRLLVGSTAASGGTALAGCSAVSLLDSGDRRSVARDWLYDPTAFTAKPIVSLQFESPRRIHDERDRLHPEVRAHHATPAYATDLDPSATDWTVSVTEDLFKAPFQYAYGGSFDETAARTAAAAPFSGDRPVIADGQIRSLQRLSIGDDGHGAYRDGLAVGVANATAEEFETLVGSAADGTDRLADAGDTVAAYLDALGFDHTAQATLAPGAESDVWRAAGTAYRVDGETTTLRWVAMNRGDPGEAALRDRAAAVDGLRDVTVGTDGPVRWAEGVADTDRVGLRGAAFRLLELPYG